MYRITGQEADIIVKKDSNDIIYFNDVPIYCYYRLPINAACKELKICATILKKVCRNYGIKRWPHRKYQSIKNAISTVKNYDPGNDVKLLESKKLDIEKLNSIYMEFNRCPNKNLDQFFPKMYRNIIARKYGGPKTKKTKNTEKYVKKNYISTEETALLLLKMKRS